MTEADRITYRTRALQGRRFGWRPRSGLREAIWDAAEHAVFVQTSPPDLGRPYRLTDFGWTRASQDVRQLISSRVGNPIVWWLAWQWFVFVVWPLIKERWFAEAEAAE